MTDREILKMLLQPRFLAYLGCMAAVEFVRGALFIALLPSYLPRDLGLTTAAVGLILSAHYLADNALKLYSGVLIDRWGPWRILLPGFVLAAFVIWVMPSLESLGSYLAAAVLFGAAAAGTWPAVVVGTTRIAPENQKATVLSLVSVAWLGGGGLGPVLINFFPPRHAFWLLAAMTLVPVAIAARGWVQRGPGAGAGTAGTADSRASAPVPGLAGRPRLREAWRRLQPEIRRTWPLLPGMAAQTMSIGMVMPVMIPFLNQHYGLAPGHLTLLLLAGGGVTVLALVPAGRLADRFSFQAQLVAGFALAAAMLLWGISLASAQWIFLPAALLGLAYALILPAWNGLMAAVAPPSKRGSMVGFFMTVEGTGITIGPVLGGLLATGLGSDIWPFYGAGIILAVMAVVYLLLPVDKYRRDIEEVPA